MTSITGGSEVGSYRIESVLREGAGGTMFLAEDHGLERAVALLVPSDGSPESEAEAGFIDDARVLARLSHPNLLPVYEVGEANGRAFAVLRDSRGRRLDEVLQDGAIAPGRAIEIGAQIAGALETLRAAGVEPAGLPGSSVMIVEDNDQEHVYLSPLEAIVNSSPGARVLRPATPDSDRSIAELAALLKVMEGEGHRNDAAIETGLEPGRYESPSAFIAAARAATRSTEAVRRHSRTGIGLVGAAVVALGIASAAFFLSRDGGDETAAVPKRASNAPAGRISATIPLGTAPGSIAVTARAVWVATTEGTVLRIDPRTNEIVGAPIRFTEAREDENVTIRAGDGRLWALDGSGGTLTRIDPEQARVTGRLRIGGTLHGAAVGNGSVWISRAPPGVGHRQTGELVRVDMDRFRQVGKPIPIGPGAFDVEVGDGFIWTMNAANGTLTRYDMDARTTRTFRVSTQPLGAALRNGVLWIPDPFDGTVTPIDARGLTPPDEVVRGASYPFSVESTKDALWVVSVSEPNPSAQASLYRIEPGSRRIAGQPVTLGPDVGWATAGFGALWIQSRSKNAILKIVPTLPPPPTRTAAPAVRDSRSIQAGPLAPGSWRTLDFPVPMTLEVESRGWVTAAPLAGVVAFGRFDSPDTFLEIVAPKQMFTANGRVQKLNDPAEIVAALASNPNVRIVSRERVRVGGVPAQQLTLHVRRFEPFPDFCPVPCVPIFPVGPATIAVSSYSDERLTIMEPAGETVVLHESEPPGEHGFAATESVLRGLRFKTETE